MLTLDNGHVCLLALQLSSMKVGKELNTGKNLITNWQELITGTAGKDPQYTGCPSKISRYLLK